MHVETCANEQMTHWDKGMLACADETPDLFVTARKSALGSSRTQVIMYATFFLRDSPHAEHCSNCISTRIKSVR